MRRRPHGCSPATPLSNDTSGSTGTSLVSVAVALGYKCLLVSSDAFSGEKLSHMRALGADLNFYAATTRRSPVELVTALIETSRQLRRATSRLESPQTSTVELRALPALQLSPPASIHPSAKAKEADPTQPAEASDIPRPGRYHPGMVGED